MVCEGFDSFSARYTPILSDPDAKYSPFGENTMVSTENNE